MKTAKVILAMAATLLLVQPAMAERIRIYVAPFKVVSGDANHDEMKEALQDLLASRLAGGEIVTVESPGQADIQLSGRYTALGSAFSIDVTAKQGDGNVAARTFVEGKTGNELLPAIGSLAQKVRGMLAASVTAAPAPPPPQPATGEAQQVTAASPLVKEASAAVANDESGKAPWMSQRLVGTYVGMAPGKPRGDGKRELFLASPHSLQLYLQGDALKLLAEVTFKPDEEILGIDTADLDGDGVPEVYLTIFNGDALVSQVWVARDNTLRKLADKLPFYFRGIALNGKERKIYTQKMSTRADFFGDIFELAKAGERFEAKSPLKRPERGDIYTVNEFTDSKGNQYFLDLNVEGSLSVVTKEGEELWRSKEKYGGSEHFFKRDYVTDTRFNGEPYRKILLQQRVQVTPEGEVLVPQNMRSSSFGAGSITSTIQALRWNGSSMVKRWHTRESEAYLTDYYYDTSRKDLVRLEVVKDAGIFDKGASVVSIQTLK